ncbi:DUF1372 family protein [Streptococcus danieliae]|uniref:DUF1372 family protein n=1 Tax=Streptococcus danieliae TaxID=747656 RepID=A0A7Z0M7M1_9STRE|nr:DUF1372 family protein [Streptococcus danieliae]MBF0700128.1 DUF1372 family protein [Streptococcus danieliae]NYS97304.1 DUF1372 family protein [Streptococcus danieliae]
MTNREEGIFETAMFGVWIMLVFIFFIQLYQGIQLNELEQRLQRTELAQRYIHNPKTTVGKVVQKHEKDGKYTLVVAGYGNFLVSKETYENVQVGDEMPGEVTERVEVLKGVGG